jgi:hypothetical protein
LTRNAASIAIRIALVWPLVPHSPRSAAQAPERLRHLLEEALLAFQVRAELLGLHQPEEERARQDLLAERAVDRC